MGPTYNKEDANSSSSSAGVTNLSFTPVKWGDLSDEELSASVSPRVKGAPENGANPAQLADQRALAGALGAQYRYTDVHAFTWGQGGAWCSGNAPLQHGFSLSYIASFASVR